MKALLVGINAKYIHTNLAIRYLYTYTHPQFDVDFCEFTIKDKPSRMVEEMLRHKPDLIGFSCYIWNIEVVLKLVSELKKMNPKIYILLGGPEVSYDATYFLNHYPIDFIISGEGEYPFYKLMQALTEHQSLQNVPQLYYKTNSNIVYNKDEFIVNIDELPSPYRLERDIPHLKNRIQYIESSRGCPYRCSYCLASLEKNVRQFDAEKVKDEIRYLMANGAKVFKFLDRTFNMRKDYALDMFEFIIREHQPGCVFQFEISGDLLNEEIIDYLNKNAPKGLIRFEMGIQSTNPLTNRLVLRVQNNDKLFSNIKKIHEGDKIILHLDLIAGLPKEDYQSFQKTFNDVFQLRPQELQLGFLKMLRGTKLRLEANLYDYSFDENPPYEVIKNDAITKEELVRIRATEFILYKYYNTYRVPHTFEYLFKYIYPDNPYLFFESFGLYWLERYETTGYQHHDLYMRLDQFLFKHHYQDYDALHSLIIFDYLKNQKMRPTIWYTSQIDRSIKHRLFTSLIDQHPELNLDCLHRYARVEPLCIHPMTYDKETTYLIKLFHPKNNTFYLLSKKAIDSE